MRLFEDLAMAVSSHIRTTLDGNQKAADNWATKAHNATRCNLPQGAGFDNGTEIDLERSTDKKLVFHTAFHHMNDAGYYTCWTEHTVTVTPAFLGGFDLKVSGRNTRDIKDYIADTFHHLLGAEGAWEGDNWNSNV